MGSSETLKKLKGLLGDKANLAKLWGYCAHLLIKVQEEELWSEDSSSFTDWIKKRTKEFGISESTLWRYLSAADYYDSYMHHIIAAGIKAPKPIELTNEISPESLELLEKLSRVVPDNLHIEYLTDYMSGKLKREDLRKKWKAYKPALDGKTARGKNIAGRKESLEADHIKPVGHAYLTGHAYNVLALSPEEHKQLGNIGPDLFKVLSKEDLGTEGGSGTDLIGLSKDERGNLKIHSIEVKADTESKTDIDFKAAQQISDFIWILTNKCKSKNAIKVPDYVGILNIKDNQIKVIKEAKKLEPVQEKVLKFLKDILTKIIK